MPFSEGVPTHKIKFQELKNETNLGKKRTVLVCAQVTQDIKRIHIFVFFRKSSLLIEFLSVYDLFLENPLY